MTTLTKHYGPGDHPSGSPQSEHGRRGERQWSAGPRIHTVQEGTGPDKVFHDVAVDRSKVKPTDTTLCGRSCEGMRPVAQFRPSDERGRVHWEYRCPECTAVLTAMADADEGERHWSVVDDEWDDELFLTSEQKEVRDWWRSLSASVEGDPYTEDDAEALFTWQQRGPWQVIRRTILEDEESDAKPWPLIHRLDAAVAKKRTTVPVRLIRGYSSPDMLDTMPQVGDTFGNPNFTATIIKNRDEALSYAERQGPSSEKRVPVVMVISVPPGTPLGLPFDAPRLPGHAVDWHSIGIPFFEAILPRNTKFRVTKVDERESEGWVALHVDVVTDFQVRKHLGPGDHPSGSPQKVHGGGGERSWSANAERPVDPWLNLIDAWEAKASHTSDDDRWKVLAGSLSGPALTSGEGMAFRAWQGVGTWQDVRQKLGLGNKLEFPDATPTFESDDAIADALGGDDGGWVITALDRAIAKRTTTEPVRLFRGYSYADDVWARASFPEPGDVFWNPNFTATTISETDALTYATDRADLYEHEIEVVFGINVPAGSHLIVAPKSAYFPEALLGRDSKFKVTKVEERYWDGEGRPSHLYVEVDLVTDFQVRKHYPGRHDQKDHGNWAERGVDMGMDDPPPQVRAHLIGSPENLLTDALIRWKGNPYHIARAALRLLGLEDEPTPKEQWNLGYYKDRLAAQALLNVLHWARPSEKRLYRGSVTRMDQLPKVGDILDIPFAPSTPEEAEARKFVVRSPFNPDDAFIGIMYRFDPGTNALPIDRLRYFPRRGGYGYSNEDEHIVTGQFRVRSVKPRKTGTYPLFFVDLEPVADVAKHLPGQHDQKDHGNWARGAGRDPDAEADLRQYLELIANFQPKGFEALVLEHGTDYTPPASIAQNQRLMAEYGVEPGELKDCFANAGRECVFRAASTPHLTYVEGFAAGVIPVHHAWLVTDDGQVIDPTWGTGRASERFEELGSNDIGPGVAYRGIPVDQEALSKLVFRRGTWGAWDWREPEGFPISKHYGPGDHPSGSSQEVHGHRGDGGERHWSIVTTAAEAKADESRWLKKMQELTEQIRDRYREEYPSQYRRPDEPEGDEPADLVRLVVTDNAVRLRYQLAQLQRMNLEVAEEGAGPRTTVEAQRAVDEAQDAYGRSRLVDSRIREAYEFLDKWKDAGHELPANAYTALQDIADEYGHDRPPWGQWVDARGHWENRPIGEGPAMRRVWVDAPDLVALDATELYHVPSDMLYGMVSPQSVQLGLQWLAARKAYDDWVKGTPETLLPEYARGGEEGRTLRSVDYIGSTRDWRAYVQLRLDHDVDLDPFEDGFETDDYERMVTEEVLPVIPTMSAWIRLTADGLEDVLDDGRFKSQHEAGRSNGAYNPQRRDRFEEQKFGEYEADHQRPIYGYLDSEDGYLQHRDGRSVSVNDVGYDSARVQERLYQYGLVAVRLKDHVKQRTTFTVGDSLDQEDNVHPSWMTEPQVWSVDPYVVAPKEPDSPIVYIDDPGTWPLYAEAQVHGAVRVEDIAEVVVPRRPAEGDAEADLFERLEALGVPVRWLEEDE